MLSPFLVRWTPSLPSRPSRNSIPGSRKPTSSCWHHLCSHAFMSRMYVSLHGSLHWSILLVENRACVLPSPLLPGHRSHCGSAWGQARQYLLMWMSSMGQWLDQQMRVGKLSVTSGMWAPGRQHVSWDTSRWQNDASVPFRRMSHGRAKVYISL